MSIVVVTEETFQQEIVESPIPVLVDFYADWCRPCVLASPTIDAIAEEYAGRVKVAKVQVDQSPKLATDHGVRGIPNFLIFKGGQRVEQLIGWGENRAADLRASLDAALASNPQEKTDQ